MDNELVELPVVSSLSNNAHNVQHPEVRDEINLRLLDVTEQTFLTLELGMTAIGGVLEEFGYFVPPSLHFVGGVEVTDGDVTYAIMDEQEEKLLAYLYVVFLQNDNGYYEFHAEVLDEMELEVLYDLDVESEDERS